MVIWFELPPASLSICDLFKDKLTDKVLFLTLSGNVRKTGRGKKMAMGGTEYYPLKKRK